MIFFVLFERLVVLFVVLGIVVLRYDDRKKAQIERRLRRVNIGINLANEFEPRFPTLAYIIELGTLYFVVDVQRAKSKVSLESLRNFIPFPHDF